MIDIMSFKH